MNITLYVIPWKDLSGVGAAGKRFLTPERRRRMERFSRESDRLCCLAAGLMLYRVLGVEQDGDLAYGRFGQPRLARDGAPRFSLAHAGGYVVLSVGHVLHGVDIEPLPESGLAGNALGQGGVGTNEALLRLCMTGREREEFWRSPEPDTFFLKIWTGKESYMKAMGLGLQLEPASFSVLPLTDGMRRVRERDWFISWFVLAGHQVAVAALGTKAKINPVFLSTEELLTDGVEKSTKSVP